MREILFRGKRTDNKGWIEGLLTIMWGQYHIIKPTDENTAYPIDPETVCQYVGYTDLRKQKAFEHDIVFYEDGGCYGHIVFKDGRFLIEWQESRPDLRSDIHFWFTERRMHIIGNIFDNPVLLEGGAE